MLKELLDLEMKKRNVGIREAAAEIGVAHTTVIRILNGGPADLLTVTKIADWIGISPSKILDAESGQNPEAVFSAIVGVVPGLERILRDATNDFKVGLLTAEDLEEITSYIAFRLKTRKESSDKRKGRVPGKD